MSLQIDINTPGLRWNKDSESFVAELSDLGNRAIDQQAWHHLPITINNPKTNKSVFMSWFRNDTDGSGEDIYGFHYQGKHPVTGKRITLLLIND